MSLSPSNRSSRSTSLPPVQAQQTVSAVSEMDLTREEIQRKSHVTNIMDIAPELCGFEQGRNSGVVDQGERCGYVNQTERNRHRTTSYGPSLVDYYSSEEDSKSSCHTGGSSKASSNTQSSRSSSDIKFPMPAQHHNGGTAIPSLLPDHKSRIFKTRNEFPRSISPKSLFGSDNNYPKESDLAPPVDTVSTTTHTSPRSSFTVPPIYPSPTISSKKSSPTADAHLPTIRRVIAQRGSQVRLEYYPQWVSHSSARSQIPDRLWTEWQTMKEDEDNVLIYKPYPGSSHRTQHGDAKSSEAGSQPWSVLRSEVASDNDSGDYMAAMLEETVTLAVQELRSRHIDHVLSVPVEFVPGSERRAAELLGCREGLVEVTTFLRLLATMTARERRKFDSVKVRYMGQVDPRVTETKGRTHRISASEYLGPVLGEWKSPLLRMKARSFFRDMEVNDEDGRVHDTDEDEDDDDDADQLSEYALLQRYKTLLLNLLTSSLWLLHPHSHLTSLIWTMIPRRQLKRHLCNSLGIVLPHDWHTYMREHYLCTYSEAISDQRSWHDLMETSLFLNKHFKDLKMAELGQRDEFITDDSGDSDAEDHHPSSGVTAANNARRQRAASSQKSITTTTTMTMTTTTPPASRKRTASALDDSDPGRITEIEDDNDDDDDADYEDGQAAYDDMSDSDVDVDASASAAEAAAEILEEEESQEEEEESFPPRPPPRKPTYTHTHTHTHRYGPVKSASSKAPRRAAIVDPDILLPHSTPTSKTKLRNQRLAEKRRHEHQLAYAAATATTATTTQQQQQQQQQQQELTEQEWAMLRAIRARQAPY